MDFKQMYQEKLVSAEKAASVIKSGDWVDTAGQQRHRLLSTRQSQKDFRN